VAGTLTVSACAPGRPASGPTPSSGRVIDMVEETGQSVPLRSEPVEPAPRDLLGPFSYDLPVESNSWVEGELDFLTQERREVVAKWLRRGDYYESFVRGVLRSYGVPTDLYYLGMIESAFLPTARSHAGAVGFWQFMPSTGRAMSLRIDSVVDERMDPIRSTRAAARHLKELREEMGDWALAVAAYNAGSGRISRGLAAFGADDYWELAQNGDLAEETKQYVPRLYAMAAIAKGRDRFGFDPPSGESFAYDSVQVEGSTRLSELARIGEVPLDALTRLNPHLLRGVTPAGGYWVWVPAGKGIEVQRAWLASAATRRAVKVASASRKAASRPDPAPVPAPTHLVRKGDTLWSIARRYGVTVDSIQTANHLADRPIQPGMKLAIPAS
jgi:membrane-bound lytic murein transglycosylase D